MKWVFALLAAVFAIGFVAFGVGAGGTGIGDVVSDFLGGGNSDIPSVESAQKAVDANPNDPEALKDLANAYIAENKTMKAAETLEKYTKLRPQDEDTLRQLAALYVGEASRLRQHANELQLQALTGNFSTGAFSVPESSGFLTAVAGDPIDQALTGDVGVQANAALDRSSTLYGKLVPIYESLVALVPEDDPTLYILLGDAADNSDNAEKAIAAYRKYLELAPEGEYVQAVKSQLRDLGAG
jgi:tetratricopeptide (TPR) repeat protein